MAVTYSCNGIVKDFPIPQDYSDFTVTITSPSGKKSTFSAPNFDISAGCISLNHPPSDGSTLTIHDSDAESYDEAISRLDGDLSDIRADLDAVRDVNAIRVQS